MAVTALPNSVGYSKLRLVDRDKSDQKVIVIVGAGFSGTMAAIHLRRALSPDWVIILFDRTGRFARGPAYAASDVAHLLNVRSVNMSALPNDSGHFERWLAGQSERWTSEIQTTHAGTFVSRRLYGRYLRALLHSEMTHSSGHVRLCADEVIDLTPAEGEWRVTCASGRRVDAAVVVVASGAAPSGRPCDGTVFHNPWAAGTTANLRPGEPVLIVGTGLTMVDLALAMHAHGFDGPIIALSRRGLVPQRYAKPSSAWSYPPFSEDERKSITALLRAVRRSVRDASARGVDWRAVIDGLRSVTASLWQSLPSSEQNRFLRHLRPYWDCHRHRLAPVVADSFDALQACGILQLRRGRVLSIDPVYRPSGQSVRIVIRERGSSQTDVLVAQRVIYAIGMEATAAANGLVNNLTNAGFARTDQHGLGLDVSSSLQVIGRGGSATPGLWALGPIVRGIFWECTAVPDIRIQAHTVAEEISRAAGYRLSA